MNDHDLLIRLDTVMGDIKGKVDHFFSVVEQKADKVSLVTLETEHRETRNRLVALEQAKRDEKIKHQTVIDFGTLTWRGMAAIAAIGATLYKIVSWLIALK